MGGIIILAMASSSRPGRPKQLLAYRGKTLIRHVVDEAVRSRTGPVWAVLGAESGCISGFEGSGALVVNNDLVVINEKWQEGMALSIRKGLSGMLQAGPELDSVTIAVCDQAFISAGLFRELVGHKQKTDKGIIASTYKDTLGTPVLFDKKYFPELLALHGQEGAKKMIAQYPEDVAGVPFDLGEIDIDIPEDYFFLQ
jgi:molybdenum cofactor cytidylyltransferase